MDWNFRNDQPIYSQLTQRLTEAIVSGIYAPGEKLPSVRELAVEAGVNPNTVQRALSELERDGMRPGSIVRSMLSSTVLAP